jgi:hypothetical protein
MVNTKSLSFIGITRQLHHLGKAVIATQVVDIGEYIEALKQYGYHVKSEHLSNCIYELTLITPPREGDGSED